MTGFFQSLTQSLAGRIILFIIAATIAFTIMAIVYGWKVPLIEQFAGIPHLTGSG